MASAVSVAAAIGSALLGMVAKRSLEKTKAHHSQILEEKKSFLQIELEDKKAKLQIELEEYKAEAAHALAVQDARMIYEYEARKRLYTQVEPLLFQLFEAAESAFHAVVSLARTQRDGQLPHWLASDGYYMRSIIHRLFSPLVIFRVLQKSTTMLDLSLDSSIRLRYAILKECYLSWTDPFGIAKIHPALPYEPNAQDWRKLYIKSPARYWRQGFVIGHLDRFLDAMSTGEGDGRRVMNFGEMETQLVGTPVYEPAQNLLLSFDFVSRPILGRMLCIYGCLMQYLMSVYANANADVAVENSLSMFLDHPDSLLLQWWDRPTTSQLDLVKSYVIKRLRQANKPGEYVKF